MLFSDPVASPAETLVVDLRDYPDWRRGRERYGVWVVPVGDTPLLDYIEAAREQLADLIHPDARRQPHLTVFVCGFHGEGDADDDFPPQRLDQQVALLQARTEAACALPLAGADSFASAAFIPVGDPLGQLAQWRCVLGEASREIRPAAYVPHITLGLYRRRVPAGVIRQRLAAIAAPPPLLAVHELHYVTYDARDQLGPLEIVRRIVLDAAPASTVGAP
ncbi:2'-5' RNA ligase family protein [Dyella japonica]|uniref:2'-5' RNA ligase family protein n=1 Tax=Dyella japonica TaxID=231455 RepID=UPI0002F7F88E|nr:2'-5' RNA ligase family protein [Dyella japonica]